MKKLEISITRSRELGRPTCRVGLPDRDHVIATQTRDQVTTLGADDTGTPDARLATDKFITRLRCRAPQRAPAERGTCDTGPIITPAPPSRAVPDAPLTYHVSSPVMRGADDMFYTQTERSIQSYNNSLSSSRVRRRYIYSVALF